LILGDYDINDAGKMVDTFEDWVLWLKVFAIPTKIFYYLLPVYFWVVSYFRLTEKQV
jgi:hypothetical protein